jgi:hypothetical protein
MTEFTKEDIEYYRKQYALWTSRRQTTPEELHLIGRLRDTLDYIEHLQAENDKLTAELARRDGIIARLKEALPTFKRDHYYCDDCWYSCPKAEDGCCDERAGEDCNCGADEWNARIDLLMKELEEK